MFRYVSIEPRAAVYNQELDRMIAERTEALERGSTTQVQLCTVLLGFALHCTALHCVAVLDIIVHVYPAL